jgi:dTDP-4-amino-4,6-dideoxygalactose transaminase
MGGDELRFVQEAFDSNWIAPVGPHISQFENELATYNNVEECAALVSGTAAIHLALLILGVKQGDEVICSTFTFSGTCNPIVYVGATPVFVDSELETWNMDPELLDTAINDRIRVTGNKPKAIIVVHLYGMPAMWNEIKRIATKYEIPIIEDAAEALGSTYNGKKLGSLGDLGVYSFNGNKIITTSGGGALVSSNKSWIQKARFLATQARDPAPYYQHSEIGYNYRLSNVCAGIGRGQMKVLDLRVKQRRDVFEFYFNAFSSSGIFEFLLEPDYTFSNRWLTAVLINTDSISPDKLRVELEKLNIETRPLWKPMHLQPIFSKCPRYVNGISERLFDQGLCLPSGSNLTENDLERVTSSIRKIVGTGW